MFIRLFAPLCALFLCLSPLHADTWTALKTSNRVQFSSDGTTWNTLAPGSVLQSGTWIRTGPRGRAILGKGSERIVYRSNALAAVSQTKSGSKTKVTHRRGSLLLSVETKRKRHTSVVTPHLAAVVKGTVFEVTAERDSSRLRVDEGVVEVSDREGQVNVPAGREIATLGQGILVARAKVTSLAKGKGRRIGLGLTRISAAESDRLAQAVARGVGAKVVVSLGLGKANANSKGKAKDGGDTPGQTAGNGNSNGNGNGNGNGGNGGEN